MMNALASSFGTAAATSAQEVMIDDDVEMTMESNTASVEDNGGGRGGAAPPTPASSRAETPASASAAAPSASSFYSASSYHDQDPPQQQQQDDDEAIDMGYEECAPSIRQRRRGSMSHDEEKQRRASIKAIMADPDMSPMAKRRSIQHLMDGRRNSIEHANRRGSMGSRTSLLSTSGGEQGGTGGFGLQRRGSLATTSAGSTHSLSSHMSSGGGGGMMMMMVPDPPLGAHAQGWVPSEIDTTAGYNASAVIDEDNQYQYEDYGEPKQQQQAMQHHHQKKRMAVPSFTVCNERTRQAELNRPYCPHYQRNCTLISTCCGAAFGCRICHDECPNLPPKIKYYNSHHSDSTGNRRYHRSASLPGSFTSMVPTSGGASSSSNDGGAGAGPGVGGSASHYYFDDPDDDGSSHQIDRFATREVICRECYTRQSSKTYVLALHDGFTAMKASALQTDFRLFCFLSLSFSTFFTPSLQSLSLSHYFFSFAFSETTA
jgi:hypothetical protein